MGSPLSNEQPEGCALFPVARWVQHLKFINQQSGAFGGTPQNITNPKQGPLSLPIRLQIAPTAKPISRIRRTKKRYPSLQAWLLQCLQWVGFLLVSLQNPCFETLPIVTPHILGIYNETVWVWTISVATYKCQLFLASPLRK